EVDLHDWTSAAVIEGGVAKPSRSADSLEQPRHRLDDHPPPGAVDLAYHVRDDRNQMLAAVALDDPHVVQPGGEGLGDGADHPTVGRHHGEAVQLVMVE